MNTAGEFMVAAIRRQAEADVKGRLIKAIRERIMDDPHYVPWVDGLEEAIKIIEGREQP